MRSSTFATRRGSGGTAMPGTGAFRLSPASLPGLMRLARRVARLPGLILPFAERRAAPAGMRIPGALAGLAAGLALTLAAMSAEAQTSVKLVGNTGQTNLAAIAGSTLDRAQGFTTGDHAGGYKLTAVKVQRTAGPKPTGATFGLFEADSSGHPTGSSLGTFTIPASTAVGLRTFTAPSGGIDLDASTTYVFVMDITQSCTNCSGTRQTQVDGEDSGAASGWSIANNALERAVGGTSWGASGVRSLKIEIHGYAKTPRLPAPTVSAVPLQPDRLSVRWSAPGALTATDYDLRYYRGSADPANEADWIEAGETGGHDHVGTLTQATITGLDPVSTYRVQVRAAIGTAKGPWSASGSGRTEALVGAWGSSVNSLVSNIGETVGGVNHLQHADVAQGFTTAGHSLGYTVTDVDLHFGTEAVGLQVRLATGVSTTSAGTTVATLRNPAALTNGVLTFSAPPGTTLDANTTYYVVVEGTSGGLSWTTFSGFPSGLRDWSIDDRFTRTSGGWGSVLGKTLIRINGREKAGDPPGKPDAPVLAAVDGSTSVTASWSAPAHTGSGITDYDVRYYEGSADPEDEADWVEEDETSGLPFEATADASTSTTITGLKPSTAYRVQVRAESHQAWGPWSDSASVTTNAATDTTNRAPTRATLAANPADGCVAVTANSSFGTLSIYPNTLQSIRDLTNDDKCGQNPPGGTRKAPMFIDADDDDLTLTAVAVIPDNVRFINRTPLVRDSDRVFAYAYAAGKTTDVRVNVTATDPHGESVSGWFTFQVRTLSNTEAPRFDQMVGTRGFRRGAPIPRWVLPPANGGNTASVNWAGQLPYFYAVSGLPPGLSFDPMTRTITGTPTQDGTYTVTYTADDADDKYSLKDAPDAADLADAARQSFVVQVGAPSIELVQIVSAPTYNSGAGNGFDTYIAGDEILVDVQFTEAVQVTGTPENPSARTRVILDVNGSNKFANLLEDGGVLYGGRRLRFGYTVAAADSDTDGVFVKPKNNNNVVLLVPTGLHVTGVKSGAAVVTTFDGLPTEGAANAKVDGSKSSDDIGPQPVSAATDNDGDTVTVTFSRALNTQVDLSGTPLEAYFSIQGAGIVGAGRRGTYQHPNSVTVSGSTLVMELGTPAQPGDTVTLSYENIGGGAWPLKDQSSTPRRVAGFVDLAVTNNAGQLTGGGLVSNLGQADYSSTAHLASIDLAQGFTTGSNADGYALDAVVLDFATAPSGLTVQLATGVSQSNAGTTVATLTSPATTAAGENRFTAPAGTVLSAATQYFVVVQGSSGTVRRTASKAEDAGAAAGWSIADKTYFRGASNTGGFQVDTGYAHKIGVDAYAVPAPPVPARASAVGTALELVFDRRLDQDSRPPGSAFTVRATDVDDSVRTIAGAGSAVVIDDATVTVTLTAAVKEGELLSVSYAKPAASPLRAAAGSPDVLSFEGFHVEGVHDSTPPKLVGVVYVQHPTNVTQTNWTLYYDEALDTGSVPAATDVTVTSQGANVVTFSHAVANNAVTFTAVGNSPTMQFSYTPPATGGIRDLAGNPAAKIDGTTYTRRPAGKPLPVSHGLKVDGVLLKMDMTRALDAASVPDTKWFTIHDTDADSTAGANSVEAVRFERQTVVLRLLNPVQPCAGATPIRVKYTKPTGASDAKLRGMDGKTTSEADGFGPYNVTNSRHSQCVTRSVSGGPSGGQRPVWEQKSVTLRFDRALDRTKMLDAADFTVEVPGASGSSAPSVRGASHTADGTGVTLALSRARNAGETATVGYTWPRSGQGLWDTAGNQFDSFSGVEVKGDEDPAALTASFHGLPDAHDGFGAFGFELHFSEEVKLSHRSLRDGSALQVANGRVTKAKRLAKGENRRWAITVQPDEPRWTGRGSPPFRAVTVSLAAASDCAAAGAVCTHAGKKLSAGVSATVPGPETPQAALPVLSVADARADEGETLAFAVTLSEAAAGAVTVDYATADHSAAAGTDYTAASGTLAFAAGETEKTVSVALLHDGASDDGETFTLTLSNPSGATIGDAEATGTVVDVPPLTATFHGLPQEHDGKKLFAFEVRFSEEFRGLRLAAFKAGALQVTNGRLIDAKRTVQGQNRSVTVRVRPSSFDDVTLTLPATTDCSQASAICTHNGRKLSGTVTATVRGPVTVSVADARASEGADAAVAFQVSLNRAASGEVTVDYATRDGTAKAGEDYTATRGTLTFAAGDTGKTVEVPILDDALDEGEETFTLKLTGARGAAIDDGEATGTIENSDPLQRMWLSRFGRTVADHVTAAVSDRLANPLSGAQVTVGGQTMNLAELEDGAWLGRTLTSIAQVMGAPSGPGQATGDDGSGPLGSGPGQTGAAPWPGTGLGPGDAPTATSAPGRLPAGRDLLLGSAFHVATHGERDGPGLAAWGRVTVGGFDGEAPADAGNVRIDGNVTTGILGTDAEWSRLLAGVAVSVSEGEGAFDQPDVDSGSIESTMTTVSPYARLSVNERISVWGLAGYGTGDMTIVQDARTVTDSQGNTVNKPRTVTRTDLSMRLAALGGRGALLTADANGGMDLALKADGFFVETTSEAISNEGDTSADASRLRLALEGSRAFQAGDGVFTPGLELGLRHDGGDAETGTGVELGGRLSYVDPGTGLSMEASLRTLVAHEDSGYEEWGASGALRLAPDAAGRGLSFSLAPTYGAPGSGVDRLWSAQDARGMAPDGGAFEPESRLEGELGYGLAMFGHRFTGTPNLGFGLSGAGSRDYRIGWRLTSMIRGDAGFEVTLDATRSEPANDNGAGAAQHGIGLRLATRW